jgi:hypothetical protein
MTITITAEHTNSDHMPPQPDRPVSHDEYGTWTVGWLPNGPLDRNWASTATILAQTIRPPETSTPGRSLRHGEGRADDADVATRNAMARTSTEPRGKTGARGGAQ